MVEGEISFGRFQLNTARRELRRDEEICAARQPGAQYPLRVWGGWPPAVG